MYYILFQKTQEKAQKRWKFTWNSPKEVKKEEEGTILK